MVVKNIMCLNPCPIIHCNIECNGIKEADEWNMILLPFGTENCWIDIHQSCINLKQLVQVLLHRRLFTIREKDIFGHEMKYHSFAGNTNLRNALNRNRVMIIDVYYSMLLEYGHKKENIDHLFY